MSDYIDTKTAAKNLGVNPSRIRQLLIKGRIRGKKIGGSGRNKDDWMIFAPGGKIGYKKECPPTRCVLEQWNGEIWEPIAIRSVKLSRSDNRRLLAGETIETQAGKFRRVERRGADEQ